MKATKHTLLILLILVLTVPIFAADTIDYVGYKELYENQKNYNSTITSMAITIFAIAIGFVLSMQIANWVIDKKRYRAFIGEIKSQQKFINDDFQSQIKRQEEQLEKSNSELKEISSIQQNTLYEIKIHKGELYFLMAKIYELNKKYDLAIRYYILFGRLSAKTDEINLSVALNGINVMLWRVKELESDLIRSIKELLNVVGDRKRDAEVKDKIIDKLSRIKEIPEEIVDGGVEKTESA